MTGTETAPPEEASEPQPADEQPDAGPPADDRPHRRHRIALRTHRLRTGIVALVLAAVLAAVPFLILKASHTIANSKAGRTVTSLSAATSRLPDTPVALLVMKGADGTVAGLTLLALDGTGSGGTALVVPAGTEVAGGEGQPGTRLAAAYADGGLDAERQVVEGVFGITTSISEEVDRAGLAALLQPYAPIHVTLDTPALDTGPDGQQVVLHPPGAVDLTADQAAQLLLAHGPNESEVGRLGRATAIWTAVLAAGAAKGAPAPTTTPGASAPATVADQLAAMAGGTTAARPVPVRPVLDAVANPQGLDLLQVDEAPTKLLLAQIMPGAISPANDHIRLQVVNATGDTNLLADAVTRLVGVGANVVIVSDAPSPTAATLIEYQDPRKEAEAQTYVPVVGPSTVQQSDERIDGIDATIVLGTDFATFAQQQAASSTTSVRSPSSTGP